MELARPAYVAAAERDIIRVVFFAFRTAGGLGLGSALVSSATRRPCMGAERWVVRASCRRERPVVEALTGAVAADRLRT